MRRVTGVQLHHSTTLADAVRFLANAVSALDSVGRTTDDPFYAALSDQARALLRETSKAERASQEALLALREANPEAFADARDGRTPWPDENDDVELRCTCDDRCLHRFGEDIDIGPNGICNCPENKRPCPRHD